MQGQDIKTDQSVYTVAVNTQWCKRCGICSAFCPAGVFKTDDFGLPSASDAQKCTGCMMCVVLCPDFAIDVSPLSKDAAEPKPGTGSSHAATPR